MKKIIIWLLLGLLFSLDAEALQRESEHFVYYYEQPDSSIIDSVIQRLEGAFSRITEDLHLQLSTKTGVHIYPTLQQFHNAIGWSNAPDWLVGVGWSEIYVVSPLNPGPAHSYSSIMNNVFIHEFTHICTGKITGGLPIWMLEGFACYEGGPYYSKASVVSAYNSLGRIPSLDELNSSFDNFSSLGGYPFCLTITNFMADSFGMASMRQFIYNCTDYSVFGGLTKNEFEQKWFDYVNKNYLGKTSGISIDNILPGFYLSPNYPNPFNPFTIINYSLPVESKVTIEIFSSSGEKIFILKNNTEPPGNHQVIWEPRTNTNVSSGIYFCRLTAMPSGSRYSANKPFQRVNKLVLVK